MIARRSLGLGVLGLPLARRAGAATPITLALSSNTIAYGGVRVAEGAGLFPKHGIDLRVIVMDSGNAAVSAVVGRSAQFAAAGPGELLATRLRGRDMVAVCNIYAGLPGSMVLSAAVAARLGVRPDAPVADRLRALNGLTVAQPSPTSAYLHPYKAAAEAVGARMKFVYMTQQAMVAALQAGAVDGAVLAAPFSLTPITGGTGVLWISGPRDDLPEAVRPASSACLQTTLDYARSVPDVIAAMRAAFGDLAVLLRTEPDRAMPILARAYPLLDPALLGSIYAENAPNWARITLDAAGIRREIAIQESSGAMQGVAGIDPAAVLLP